MAWKILCGKHLTVESFKEIFKGNFNTENNFKANYFEKMQRIKIKESLETTSIGNIASKLIKYFCRAAIAAGSCSFAACVVPRYCHA